MKRLLLLLLAICLLAGCQKPIEAPETTVATDPPVTPGKTHTSFPGLEVAVEDLRWDNEKTVLTVNWKNDTPYDVTYGSAYEIQYFSEDTWIPCALQEELYFTAIAYCLFPGQQNSETYDLTQIYDVSKPGTYRFTAECFVYDSEESSTKCQLTAEFSVGSDMPAFPLAYHAESARTDQLSEDADYPAVILCNTLEAYTHYCQGLFPTVTEAPFTAYDAAFFENHYLVLVLLEEPSGSITHTVRDVLKGDGQTVSIFIDRTVPEVCTDDMAYWHIFVEIDQENPVTKAEDIALYLDSKLAWNGSTVVEPTPEVVFQSPPKLSVITPMEEVTLKATDYDWTARQEDGTAINTITDISSRPPEEDLLKPILINSKYSESIYAITPDGTYEPTNALGYLIKTQWEAQPDTVTYTCWPTDVWTDPETPSKEVYLLEDNAFYVWDECGIYEITATWDAPGYQGTATYYVYFMVVSNCLVAEESSNVCNATRVTFHLEDGNYSFMGGNAVILTDLLLGLNYDPMKVCRCMPEFTVDTDYKTGYGINLRENYVRCDQGQAELTPEQAYAIREYMQWAKSQRGNFSGTVSSR